MGQQRLIPIPIIQEGSNRGLIMTDPRYEVQFKFLVFLLSTAQFNHELSLSVLQKLDFPLIQLKKRLRQSKTMSSTLLI